MGGEKQMEQGAGRLWVGSPPRGRGKVSKGIKPSDERGITPAWAGKSSWTIAISTRTLDHPRMGGEKMKIARWQKRWKGSPPRWRGKVSDVLELRTADRITPA